MALPGFSAEVSLVSSATYPARWLRPAEVTTAGAAYPAQLGDVTLGRRPRRPVGINECFAGVGCLCTGVFCADLIRANMCDDFNCQPGGQCACRFPF